MRKKCKRERGGESLKIEFCLKLAESCGEAQCKMIFSDSVKLGGNQNMEI
jgi:hypothetical protein